MDKRPPCGVPEAWDHDSLCAAVRPYLTEKRWQHTLGCCRTALALADRWGADRQDAMCAALLHDITKKLSDEEQLQLCRKYGIINEYNGSEFHSLIHADTAAALAADVFHMPAQVVRAVALHTLGDSRMTTLDKIINLADAIEPGREYPGVAEIREMAMQDLDRALLMSLQSTLRHVAAGGGVPNRRTEEACRALEQNLQTNKQENTI